jgi:hypothetical protein
VNFTVPAPVLIDVDHAAGFGTKSVAAVDNDALEMFMPLGSPPLPSGCCANVKLIQRNAVDAPAVNATS